MTTVNQAAALEEESEAGKCGRRRIVPLGDTGCGMEERMGVSSPPRFKIPSPSRPRPPPTHTANALWKITNSPGLAKKDPSCLTPRGGRTGTTGGGGDMLGCFPTPQPSGSPSMNYNRFFSPSQFSWSPLPGHSPAPPAANQPLLPGAAAAHASSGMPSFFSSLAPSASSSSSSSSSASSSLGAEAEGHLAAANKAAALAAAAAAAASTAEGEAGFVAKKKAYSKKLDFAGPPTEKASRMWLSLDTEAQRVARDGPRAAPPASPACNSSAAHHLARTQQSPFKYQGEGMMDFFTNAPTGGGNHKAGQGAGARDQEDVEAALLLGAEEELGGLKRWHEEFEEYVKEREEEEEDDSRGHPPHPPQHRQQMEAPRKLLMPLTTASTATKAVPMNQHGGSNWGGIQVRVKKSLGSGTSTLPSLKDAMLSPSSIMPPPPQSPRTTTATTRGGFAPGSPVLEAMAMVSLSQSPSVFPATARKKKVQQLVRAPRSLTASMMMPPSSSLSSSKAGVDAAMQTPELRATSALNTSTAKLVGGSRGSPGSTTCSCKKSRCLKLYCECFRGGATCGPSCKCKSCCNTPEFEKERTEARDKIVDKKKRMSGKPMSPAAAAAAAGTRQQTTTTTTTTTPQEEKEREEAELVAAAKALLIPASPPPARAPLSTRRATRSGQLAPVGLDGTPQNRRSSTKIVFTVKPSSPAAPMQRRSSKRKAEVPSAGTTRRTTPSKGKGEDEFLLSVFGPRSRINKQNSLEILSYLDNDDMADAWLVSSLWNRLCLETLDDE